jgi:hypothetical protein
MPLLFWMEPTIVVDNVAGWCSCSSGMLPKVPCSDPSMMVDRVWVDGWWKEGLVLIVGLGYAIV